jgi:DNA-binding NarL/FixJ family response regulator
MGMVTKPMAFRILLAAGNADYLKSLNELTTVACGLLPMRIEVEETTSVAGLRQRLAAGAPDALVVDWSLAPADLLATVGSLTAKQPEMRVLLLIPDVGLEYREAAWGVGVCACVPRDRIDPEWLQAMLCVMNRAKEREARIRSRVA